MDHDGCVSLDELEIQVSKFTKLPLETQHLHKSKSECETLRSTTSNQEILHIYKETKMDEVASNSKIRKAMKNMQSYLNLKGQTLFKAFQKKQTEHMKMNK